MADTQAAQTNNFLFCATCETFGIVEGDTLSLSDAHAGHRGTIVTQDDPDVDIARLFVGWLRIQRRYFDGRVH